jgi:hypothetical protein
MKCRHFCLRPKGFDMSIAGVIYRKLMIDRKCKDFTLAELQANLEKGKESVLRRHANAADNEKNRALMCHVIGIERWGQSRLQVLLGDPLIEEEYDNYAPADSLTMAELGETFEEVRERLLRLLSELHKANIALTATTPHNQMGNMTLRSWLHYLSFHAVFEADRMK